MDDLHISWSPGPVSNLALTNRPGMSFDAFCRMMEQAKPKPGPKDGAYFVRGPVNGNGKRHDANVLYADLVVLDGDSTVTEDGELVKGAPHPLMVHEVLTGEDIPHAIYTSHSHTTECPRYRVVVPARLRSTLELVAAVDWLLDLLHRESVPLAPVKENLVWSQAWYYPRLSSADAEYLVYTHYTDERLDIPAIVDWHLGRQEPSRKGSHQAQDETKPWHWYNARHGTPDAVTALLQRHGYTSKGQGTVNGEVSYRFLHPESTSGQPGLRLFRSTSGLWVVMSSHGADPLNDGYAHDAFSVFAILEHGGDTKAAGRAVRSMGYEEPGQTKSTPPGGERGERGENPRGYWDVHGARAVRKGANSPEDEAFRARMMAKANQVLTADPPETDEYPIDALGPFADAARAIAEGAQLRPAMAGQSVLATSSLLAQGKYNVRSLDGPKPLSLNALTIGDSGDGKTTGDKAAQGAVTERQRQDSAAYKRDMEDWEAADRKTRGDPPGEPYMVMRDGTVEGIRKAFAQGLSSQGLFTSEAAAVLSGYGMRLEHRAKTAAVFNELFDDGQISVARGTNGRLQLYGRRMASHLMIQPVAVEETLSDPTLSAMGFWPRFLAAWPEPNDPRKAWIWKPETNKCMKEYWALCRGLMDTAPPEDCDKLPELEPTPGAMKKFGAFFERMEKSAKGRDAPLADIKPFALRAAEQVIRVAGVQAVFEATAEPKVDVTQIENAMKLVGYSLDTWQAIFGDKDRLTTDAWALALYDWLLKQNGCQGSETQMLRIGPKHLRSAVRRDTALGRLEQAGLVVRAKAIWTPDDAV